MAWLDVSDAFGTIPHACIAEALRRRGVGETLVSIIKNLYKDSFPSVTTLSGSSGPLKMLKGIKQGGPLSGLLFILGINHIVEELDTGEEHSVLAYADDITLLASTPEGLQNRIDAAVEALSGIGMKVNPRKCSTMHLSGCAPVGLRNTTFNIADHRLRALREGETQHFLGNPVGFRAVPAQAELEEIVTRAKKILTSALAPWQRLDALRTFVSTSR